MESIASECPWEGLEELRPALRDALARRCRDGNEVDDVIQETFLRAARYRSSVHDVRNLKSWALRIAYNVLADRVRSETRLSRAPRGEDLLLEVPCPRDEDDPWAPARELRCGNWLLEEERALDFLAGSLDGLRPEDQRLIDAYYREHRGTSETARACAIPRHLVKVRLFRTRRRLARLLHRHASTGAGRFDGPDARELSAAPHADEQSVGLRGNVANGSDRDGSGSEPGSDSGVGIDRSHGRRLGHLPGAARRCAAERVGRR